MKSKILMASLAAAALGSGLLTAQPPGMAEVEYPPMDPKNLPDRLCGDPSSPYYPPQCKKVGVMFDGHARPDDVAEYCVSEGWIKHTSKDPRGQVVVENSRFRRPMLTTKRGTVTPFWRG